MRRLVIALLVLAGLVVAADFGSAALAESAVSRQMRAQLGLVDDPEVRINGFPFLTQAVSGDYSSVDVDASRISVGELRELTLSAQLRNVSAPLPMLLSSGPKTLDVGVARGTVSVPADDVARLVPGIEDLRIETVDEQALQQAVEDGADTSVGELDPDSAVRLVGTATLPGQREEEVSVIAVLELADGGAQIAPRHVRLGDGSPALPTAVQQAIGRQFTVRVDPGALPLQVTPTGLRVRNGALEITGTARDLLLGDGAPTPTG